MKKNSLMEGTIVTYIILLIIKLCGALYVIPFYKIVGTEGGVLYSYAYNLYIFFLNISVSGIPVAISIIISEYNALKMFNEREHALKVANKLIFIISFISFLCMFIFAPSLARFFVSNASNSYIADIALVIRVISLCLLVVPFLSTIRGYLQGNKYFTVVSFSQLIEQFVKMFVVLLGAYITINVLNKSVTTGVAVSLIGAFLSGLAAYLYLRRKINKNKDYFNEGVTSYKDSKITTKEIVKKILLTAFPLIIVAITHNLYDIMDLKLIIVGLQKIGYDLETTELLSSIIVTWATKICMVINSLAIGLSSSLVPFIVEGFVNKEYKKVNAKFNQSINTILFVSIPLALIIGFFSKDVYHLFYGESKYGSIILTFSAITSIGFSLLLVINSILQSMKKYNIIYLNTIVGLFINLCLDVPLIMLLNKLNFHPYLGTIFATIIGQIISILIILIILKRKYDFKYKDIFTSLLKITYGSLIIYIILYILTKLITMPTNFGLRIIVIGVYSLISIIVYLYISYKNKLLEESIGSSFITKIKNKFKK